jgi:hypothetical protein
MSNEYPLGRSRMRLVKFQQDRSWDSALAERYAEVAGASLRQALIFPRLREGVA